MKARGALAAAVVALLACACREDAGAPSAPVAPAVPAEAAPGGTAEEPDEATLRAPPSALREPLADDSEAQARIDAVLDADPSGAGLDFLMRSAREDPDPSVREAAVIALGDSEERRAIDALIVASEDADARVVRAALDALAWSDDRQARAALERLARHPDAEIAAAAEEALAE